jgi:endonuclease/exonuclease/phosphatase family metal-dependent hydrolase
VVRSWLNSLSRRAWRPRRLAALGAATGFPPGAATALLAIVVAAAGSTGCIIGKQAVRLRSEGPPPHVVLAVVTWNVHAGRGDLPRFIDDLTHGRLTGVPVRDYAILLQETIAGTDTDAVKIAREHGSWAYFEPVRESRQGLSGNAIVTSLQPLTVRTIVLPRERRVRKAIAMTFEIDGQPLFIVDAHLENRVGWLKGAIFSDNARKRQAEALLRELPGGHGVVGGDLNTWLGANEPAWTLLGRRFQAPPDDATEPTFANRLILDHLFFDLPPQWTASRQVIADRYNSDHHPVLGLITLAGGRA